MADNETTQQTGAAPSVPDLPGAGEFTSEVSNLQQSLGAIADDLKIIVDTTTVQREVVESLASHILAVEAILMVMLRNNPVEPNHVADQVRKNTKDLTKTEDDNPLVRNICETLLRGQSN